ncbi:hypothetical protein ACR9E3_17460 [Actinomycetospora sp. C-140]
MVDTGRMTIGTARPSEVQRSAWLWIAAVVLHVASLLAVYVAVASITSRTPTGALFGAPHLVFVVVSAAIGLALVLVMRHGRNWARVTLTVLGVLNVVGTVVGLVFALAYPVPRGVTLTLGGPVGVAIDIAQTVCIVAGIVLFYRPRANAWFAAARR